LPGASSQLRGHGHGLDIEGRLAKVVASGYFLNKNKSREVASKIHNNMGRGLPAATISSEKISRKEDAVF
jgi:hypothetical protein